MAIGLLLKVITNLGKLSGDLKDFEGAAKALFAGQLTKAQIEQLLSDVEDLLSSGIISIPGIDSKLVISTIQSGDTIVEDVIKAVSDVKAGGVAEVLPDLGKAVDDLIAALGQGVIGLTDSTKEQVLQVLNEIKAGL